MTKEEFDQFSIEIKTQLLEMFATTLANIMKQMTGEEFNKFSLEIKHKLVFKFHFAPVLKTFVEELKAKSDKFTSEGLKQAVKDGSPIMSFKVSTVTFLDWT